MSESEQTDQGKVLSHSPSRAGRPWRDQAGCWQSPQYENREHYWEEPSRGAKTTKHRPLPTQWAKFQSSMGAAGTGTAQPWMLLVSTSALPCTGIGGSPFLVCSTKNNTDVKMEKQGWLFSRLENWKSLTWAQPFPCAAGCRDNSEGLECGSQWQNLEVCVPTGGIIHTSSSTDLPTLNIIVPRLIV